MLCRIALFAIWSVPGLFAQFSGLSSTTDGSSVYFASTLRLKGTAEPRNGKVFLAGRDGVKLFRAHDPIGISAGTLTCTVSGFSDYLGAETSSTGTIALSYRAQSAGGCSFPPNLFSTEVVTASGSAMLPGVVRLSAGGRYAVIFLASTARPFSSLTISFLDLQSGTQQPVPVAQLPSPQYFLVPYNGGRVIADDGTAVLAATDRSSQFGGYLLKPGVDPKPFSVRNGVPLMIAADASKVVYQDEGKGLLLLDLRTLESTLLIPAAQPADGLTMSDDARRLLFVRDGQVHVLDTAAITDRVLTNEPAKITAATISGDGRVVHAVTGRGRLLEIDVQDGTSLELIGPTPYLDPFLAPIVQGLTATLSGGGLSDSVIDATLPVTPSLGDVTVWVGERKVPVLQVAPKSVSFLAPWDLAGSTRIRVEVPGDHMPFDDPEVEVMVGAPSPRAGVLARQNWEQTYVGPVNTGEIIHVFAIGFGAVSPEVPEGTVAPSAEPLPRLTRTLACSTRTCCTPAWRRRSWSASTRSICASDRRPAISSSSARSVAAIRSSSSRSTWCREGTEPSYNDRDHMRTPFFGEFMGTLILILMGNGVVAGVLLKRSKGENAGWLAITAGWAFAVMTGVVTALACGSPDAHLNPAVTLGAAVVSGDFSKLASYVPAQLLGAMTGAALVWLAYLPHWEVTPDPSLKLGCFATIPAIRTPGANLFTECIGTFVLVLVAFAFGSKAVNAPFAPPLVGMLVWAIGLSLGGPTGYAINPARDLGPRIVHAVLPIPGKKDSDWGYAAIPILGPLVGGAVAGVFVRCVGM